MKTLHLSTSESDIRMAGEIIRRGGLVAFPTETVYGLGADALNGEAVKSVYAAKGRPQDNPMIVHIADTAALDELIAGGVKGLSKLTIELMNSFWPGPLTIVLPKSEAVPAETTGGLDTVAVRMPGNETARALIAASERPIAAPSANLSGKPSPTTFQDVLEDMEGRIDAVIMGEQCEVGIESTVLDMTDETPVILRPGRITEEMLEAVAGRVVPYDRTLTERPAELADPEKGVAELDFKPKSPGMKYKHYAPKAKVRIIEGDEKAFAEESFRLGTLALDKGLKSAILDYEGDAEKAAHRLFADMRELDRLNYDIIFIRALDEEGLGFSVMNRMLKSAGYDIVEL